MLTKDDFLAAMIKECDICIHLFVKIPEGGLDYRPSPVQWSTLELLRYLTFVGIGMSRAMTEDSWDAFAVFQEESAEMPARDFPEAMERQKDLLRDYYAGLDWDSLGEKTVVLPSGEEFHRGRALLDMAFRCLSGYRMQLFLYAKAAGNHDLTTPNCWAGMDIEL